MRPHPILSLILLLGYLIAGAVFVAGIIGGLVGLHAALGGGQ